MLGLIGLGVGVLTNALFEDGVETLAYFYVGVILSLERGSAKPQTIERISRLWPTREEARAAWPAVLRGTGIGSLLGVLPGGGALIAAFAAYVVEKKVERSPPGSARVPSRA